MSRKNPIQRLLGSSAPKEVEAQFTVRTEFYRKQLCRTVKGLFELECPDEWQRDYVLNLFITEGYVIITDTKAGILPVKASIHGHNYANFPTDVTVALPILGDFTRKIGVDAELIYLEWLPTRIFYNFREIVDIFAEKLASCDAGIDVNIINSRLAYVAEADTKAQADTLKRIMSQITQGEPLVVYRKDALAATSMNVFFNNLRQNFIAGDLQDVKRTIYNEFLSCLGVNNANTDKKERLITSEVDSNLEELIVNISEFEDNLEVCNRRIKKMFPDLNFSLKLRFDGRTREELMNNDILRGSGDLEHSEPTG